MKEKIVFLFGKIRKLCEQCLCVRLYNKNIYWTIRSFKQKQSKENVKNDYVLTFNKPESYPAKIVRADPSE